MKSENIFEDNGFDFPGAICPRCGEEYLFAGLKEMDNMPVTTPCRKCGFLLFQFLSFKITAMQNLMKSDPRIKEFIETNKTEELNQYMEDKMGLLNFSK